MLSKTVMSLVILASASLMLGPGCDSSGSARQVGTGHDHEAASAKGVARKTGDVAPPFEAKTIDGKIVKLADFKGKYLLVDFWATWCGPCIAETPDLETLWQEHGKNPRFAMLGLSLDNSVDALRAYAKKKKLGWMQGFIGQEKGWPILHAYGQNGRGDDGGSLGGIIFLSARRWGGFGGARLDAGFGGGLP